MMIGRKLRVACIVFAVGLIGLVGASSAAAVTSLYHPNAVSRNFNGTPAQHGWTATTDQDFALCIPPLTCPTVTNSTPAAGGSGGGVGNRFIRTNISGVSSIVTTTTTEWSSPTFTYQGAAGQQPATVTFTMDRRVDAGALLQLLVSEDYSVFLDNITTETSLTVIDHAPIFNQLDWTSVPATPVNPAQLTIGNTYQLRIETRLGIPVAVLPSGDFDYDNVVLAAVKPPPPDTDGDGVPDSEDNCPFVPNPPQNDLDGDGLGNACDPDIDGDGVPNGQETGCIGTTGSGSPVDPDSDNDGVKDGQDAFPCDPNESNDADHDGVGDGTDNCPTVSNANQADLDGDHVGDACDTDIDGDGVPNGQENPAGCPAGSSPTDPDSDDDGVNDGQDAFPCDPTKSSAGGGAGGVLGGVGTGGNKNTVRFRARCPRDAVLAFCKVRASARLSKNGLRVTPVFKTRIGRGKLKNIHLTIAPQFNAEANALGKLIVVRKVKEGPGHVVTRFLSLPLL